MNKKALIIAGTVAAVLPAACAAMTDTVMADTLTARAVTGEWRTEDGNSYWYENGVRQGVKYNEDGSLDLSYRGKEIYDPSSDAWYWLDNVQNGAKATSKDVYQESAADADGNVGKWVRYDADGHMVKGWQTTENGTYYFDPIYGTMYKGDKVIDGKACHFNEATGVLDGGELFDDNGSSLFIDGWHVIGGTEYWYENGVRQGCKTKEDGSVDDSYRGKEIYDPSSDAWYWLDNVQYGAKAVSKDVYQESEAGAWGDITGEDGKTYGKWVRYDENGHMVKGWDKTENGTYYFDPVYGAMVKGVLKLDGYKYTFDKNTGVLVSKEEYTPETEVKIVDGKPVPMKDNEVDNTYSGELTSEDGKTYRFENGQPVYGMYWYESVPYVYDETTGERVSVNADTDSVEDFKYEVERYGIDNTTPPELWDEIKVVKTNLSDGWHVIDGKTYYAKNGELAFGTKIIDNHIYAFDRNTCELLKDKEKIYQYAGTAVQAYANEDYPDVYDAKPQFDKLTGKLLNAGSHGCGFVDSWGNVVAHYDRDVVDMMYYLYAYDAYGNKLTIWRLDYSYDADKPVTEWDFMPEHLDYYQDNVDLPDEVLYDPATGQIGPAMSEFGDRPGTVMTGLKVRYERIYTDGIEITEATGTSQYAYYNVKYVGDYSEEFLQYLNDNGYEVPDKAVPTMSEEQIIKIQKKLKEDEDYYIARGITRIIRTE